MYVREVYDLFRSYCDEADETFLTPAQAQLYLKTAYGRFRNLVTAQVPNYYLSDVEISVAGANFYDLADPASAVRILGNPAGGLTDARLARLVSVTQVQSSSFVREWTPVGSVAELLQYSIADAVYYFGAPSLIFPGAVNVSLSLFYTPVSEVDWSKTASSDNEFIDDLDEWHDLVALLAYGQYAIRDGADSAQVLRELAARKDEFMAYLAQGIDLGGNRIALVR